MVDKVRSAAEDFLKVELKKPQVEGDVESYHEEVGKLLAVDVASVQKVCEFACGTADGALCRQARLLHDGFDVFIAAAKLMQVAHGSTRDEQRLTEKTKDLVTAVRAR